jgi:hypoxanthine phosphoribosyltransferase
MVVLTGAIIFAADLGRELFDRAGINVRFHLIKTSVYDDAIKKSGEHFRAVKHEITPKDIEGKDILVVEDIVDQGFTLTWLKNYLLSERKVSSIKICCLLDKVLKHPSAEVRKIRKQLLVDYIGFKIPDFWVAGYGIDVAQELRNLPCVVTIDESLYI